jgi:hypothetical protein
MRAATLLTVAALLAAAGGCDRLPARGGEGQPCFGNGECGAGLECNADNRCVRTDCTPDCDGKCGGVPDGCGGTCPLDCPAGQWCDAAGGDICRPCEVDAHCGSGCENCSDNTQNKACIDDGQGYRCGCMTGEDCDGRDCNMYNYCDCAPDCSNKCAGESDGCGGTCPDPCQEGDYCEGGFCHPCEEDAHCGPQCVPCPSESPQHPVCREGGDGDFRCVCTTDAHCVEGDICDRGECITPPSELVLQHLLPEGRSASAVEMAACSAAGDPWLLVGTRAGPQEEPAALYAWPFDLDQLELGARQELDASPYSGDISSVAASKSTCSVFAADAAGKWARIPYDDQSASFTPAVERAVTAQLLAIAPGGDFLAAADYNSLDLYTLDADSDALNLICSTTCADTLGAIRSLGFSDTGAALAAACTAQEQDAGLLAVNVLDAVDHQSCDNNTKNHYPGYSGLALAFPSLAAGKLAFAGESEGVKALFLTGDPLADPLPDPQPAFDGIPAVDSMVFAGPGDLLLLGSPGGRIAGFDLTGGGGDSISQLPDDFFAHSGCSDPLLLDFIEGPNQTELLLTACGREIRIWTVPAVLAEMGYQGGR